MSKLSAPFPYFGGKRSVAQEIWRRLGDVGSYAEPFAGSLAVLLSRPHKPKVETVNDVHGFIVNFWRAVKWAPEEVAQWADWPVTEHDLEARHYWLVTEGAARIAPLMSDPDGYDAKVAGWWCWGACAWIGSGWCAGDGPWRSDGDGWSKLPHLGDAGRGINRKLPHLSAGRGINRQLPHLGAGRGAAILDWFAALSDRLRMVRICCGDWSRIVTDTPLFHAAPGAPVGVLLDPPYSAVDRAEVYASDSFDVAHKARAWAIANGHRKGLRIAFCGYSGEFSDPWPEGWVEWTWRARGGYGSQGANENANRSRERIWFSPHCLADLGGPLFAEQQCVDDIDREHER